MKKYIIFLIFISLGCSSFSDENLQKYFLAKGYYLKGDLSNAEKLFKEVYSDESEFEDVDLHLIKIQFYKGNFDECLNLIDDTLEKGRWQQQSLLYKIRILMIKQEKLDELIPLIDKALKIDSSNIDTLLIAGKVYFLNDKIPESILAYSRIISEKEKIKIAHQELSNIYQKMGVKENSDYHKKLADKLSTDSYQDDNQMANELLKKIKKKRK